MPIERSAFDIRAFDPVRQNKDDFDCGIPRLNNFLRLTARKQQKDDLSRVYVALRTGDPRILGYHAINMSSMDARAMDRPPKNTPSHGNLPILFLSHVAVDTRVQGEGLGRILMRHVARKAVRVADQAGCHAVLLDVIDDGGPDAFDRRKAWYASFGFRSFAGQPERMFVTIQALREILGRSEDSAGH